MPHDIPEVSFSGNSDTTTQSDRIYTVGSTNLSQSSASLPSGFLEGNGILRPSSTVSLPDLPEGYKDVGGIIAPVQKPPETILVAGKEDIEKFVPQEQDSLPDKVKGDILLFSTLPWTYFDKKLKECAVQSPVEEIEEVLEKGETLDAVDLKYNKWEELKEEDGQVSENFYTFLEKSADILIDDTVKDIQFVRNFFKAANTLIETQIYSNRCYKLKDARALEKVLRAFDKAQVPLSKEVCDFISYFEIPPSIIGHINRNIEPRSKHALKYYTDSVLSGDNEEFENVGIEIEGIPRVTLGTNSYPGFKMGIDGGGKIPELRRKKEDIKYDLKYKKDLYDLWYWAKMSRVMGLSVHVHLDDPDGEGMTRFQKVYGYSRDSVREKSHSGTRAVEIRLNLPFYPEEATASRRNFLPKTNSIFDPQIYALQPLIDELIMVNNSEEIEVLDNGIKIAKKGEEERMVGEFLCSWWKRGFTIIDKHRAAYSRSSSGYMPTIENDFVTVIRDMTAQEAIGYLEEGRRHMPPFSKLQEVMEKIRIEELTPEVAMDILKIANYADWVCGDILRTMEPRYVTVEFIRQILKESTPEMARPDDSLVLSIIKSIDKNHLTPELSSELLSNLDEPEDHALTIAFKINPSYLTREFALELIKLSNYYNPLVIEVFSKMNKDLIDLDYIKQVLHEGLTSTDVLKVGIGIAMGIDSSLLTVEVADELIELSRRGSSEVISAIVSKMNKELITPELAVRYLGISDDATQTAIDFIENIDSKHLTKEFLETVIFNNSKIVLYDHVLHTIIRSVDNEVLSHDFLFSLLEKSSYRRAMIDVLIEKNDKVFLTTDFLEGILERFGEAMFIDEVAFLLDSSPPGVVTSGLIKMAKAKFGHKFAQVINSLKKDIFSQEILKELLDSKGEDGNPDAFLLETKIILEKMSQKLTDIELVEEIIRRHPDLISLVLQNIDPSLLELDFIYRVMENPRSNDYSILTIIDFVDKKMLTEDFVKYLFGKATHSIPLFSQGIAERIEPEFLTDSLISELLSQSHGSFSVVNRIIGKIDSSRITKELAKEFLEVSDYTRSTSRALIRNMAIENMDSEFIETLIEYAEDEIVEFTEAIPEELWSEELFWKLIDRSQKVTAGGEKAVLENVNKEIFNTRFLKEVQDWFLSSTSINSYTLRTLLGDALWINVDFSSKEFSIEDWKGEPHDAEQFLDEVFEWIEDAKNWRSKTAWTWRLHEDGIVDMGLPERIPAKFVDMNAIFVLGDERDSGSGIPALIERIGERKIFSISSGGRWYLKIV
jgi:hypothetical protein